MLAQAGLDRGFRHEVFRGAWGQFHQVLGRIETVPREMRGHGVTVGGKRAGLDQDLRAPPERAKEARQHQVQIHRQ